MPEWLMGVVGAVSGAGLLALIVMLTKRYNLYIWAYNVGDKLRKIGLGYDLPILGGDAETKIKDHILASFSDVCRGLARGVAGLPKGK